MDKMTGEFDDLRNLANLCAHLFEAEPANLIFGRCLGWSFLVKIARWSWVEKILLPRKLRNIPQEMLVGRLAFPFETVPFLVTC